MSRRASLERRLAALGDIREIMNAMKTLSLMETRKLSRALDAQAAVIATLEEAADDFVRSFPKVVPATADRRDLLLLVGSERGFCGNFNEAVIASWSALEPAGTAPLIVVGRRLAAKMPPGSPAPTVLPGASAAEELPPVLLRAMEAVGEAMRALGAGAARLTVLAHDAQGRAVRPSVFEPFREAKGPARRFPRPPLLNAPPEALVGELARQYLSGCLSGLLAASLLAENQARLEHMDDAIRRLDQQVADGRARRNRLRQEEIIEEIEVLLLSRG